ncbi:PTS sugar transporter subunit IIA [Lactobacillus mulieris]|uniref:PTS sugar transporter subunit IIA n=1 Tax=Lactobacillus mulieris TaxID=2508708 RepID=A0AAW5WXZ2_9LACO|nr:PTS sugar transporter subunit IIA [Lactobacillus mulieris]MCZ3621723.1 PTS sugar transporter subunit IIA [Lactobacillus mulieris]MCZ3623001.1 PTS sugar transporter subunit IIA [Lactobacillus mulieris]MCZ3635730.1 PTS sugar transporter subunit IIA [Lactobacillus mulieris]MCZ3690129.1 PTS sugar transporter subunit IIA [Lactobacillus mulieris]MCZ3696516.1 PTS sugar transporter subunit IIA [Lactobacillus mulieris]
MGEKLKIEDIVINRNLEANFKEEVISKMAKRLQEKGYVTSDYEQALLKREKEFPTGLPSSQPIVAIPHANSDLVNKTTIEVATLKTPVIFYNMGSVNEKLEVQIVIMLAISEPHGQIEMLQKIVGIVQNQELRERMLLSKSNQELKNLIVQALA